VREVRRRLPVTTPAVITRWCGAQLEEDRPLVEGVDLIGVHEAITVVSADDDSIEHVEGLVAQHLANPAHGHPAGRVHGSPGGQP
jgi:hypothetical protein